MPALDRAVVSLLLFWMAVGSAAAAEPTVVPEAVRKGRFDVTKAPLNADPSGKADATAAIQAAIDASWEKHQADKLHRIIYLPKGTYLVSDELTLRADGSDDNRAKYTTFIGDGPEASVIKLADNAPAFQDGAKPVLRYLKSSRSNDAFFNEVRDLTIDIGAGNPAAIALLFHANNNGTVRNVTLRSSDPQGVGHTGLALTKLLGGLSYIKDVTIQGFDIGVDVETYISAYVFEDLTLIGQRQVGLRNTDKSVSIRRLTSDNGVPAIQNVGGGGQIVLIDSQLRGGATDGVAIDNQKGSLFVRNVEIIGYGAAINNRGEKMTMSKISEFVSDKPITLDDGPTTSRGLPIKDAPQVPVDSPDETFFVTKAYIDDYISKKEGSSTADAIQAAIDSGKTTIAFETGGYGLSKPVVIRGNVRRFHAGWGYFAPSGNDMMKRGNPLFILEDTRHDAVVIEKIGLVFKGGSNWYLLQNNSSKTLILRDIGWAAPSHAYRNEGTGDVFMENVHTITRENKTDRPAWLFKNQNVWARHFNPENDMNKEPEHSEATLLVVEGGSFWNLGFKLGEFNGPYVHAKNGAQVELLGGFWNSLGGGRGENRALFINENADLTLIGVERMSGKKEGPHRVAIREIDDGNVNELLHDEFPYRRLDNNKAIVIPLYRGDLD